MLHVNNIKISHLQCQEGDHNHRSCFCCYYHRYAHKSLHLHTYYYCYYSYYYSKRNEFGNNAIIFSAFILKVPPPEPD